MPRNVTLNGLPYLVKDDDCQFCGQPRLNSSGHCWNATSKSFGKCTRKATSESRSNTNAKRGEDRDKSFDGESHTAGGSKKGKTGRVGGQSYR